MIQLNMNKVNRIILILSVVIFCFQTLVTFQDTLWLVSTLPVQTPIPESLRQSVLPSRCGEQVSGYEKLVKAAVSATKDMPLTTSGKINRLLFNLPFAVSRNMFLSSASSLPNETWIEAPRKPIIIAGLGRSGTTHLHRLMAQNPNTMSLRIPDMILQGSIPEAMNIEIRDKSNEEKIKKAESGGLGFLFINSLTGFDPEKMSKWHDVREDVPEEEYLVLQHNFLHTLDEFILDLTNSTSSPNQDAIRDIYDSEYDCSVHESYDYLKAYLMRIQNHPETKIQNKDLDHWILKSPIHSRNLNIVTDTFPDAQLVFLHRSPDKLVSSLASFLYSSWEKRIDQSVIPKSKFLEAAEISMAELARRFLKWDKANPGKGIHIQFEDFIKNPIATVEYIYEQTEQKDNNSFQFKHNNNLHKQRMKNYIEKDDIRRQTKSKPGKYSHKDFDNMVDNYLEDLKQRYPVWKEYESYHQ